MPRTDPDLAGDELSLLTQFLEYHRATLVDKVTGLSAEQLHTASVPPSTLTLGGLVKHLALVEDDWFQVRLLGRPDPDPWVGAPFDVDPDWDFHSAPDNSAEELMELYLGACERSRAAIAEVGGDLDTLSVQLDRHTGEPFSLRWILIHLIEETARHNGHVDLLREALDGTVGE